MLLVLLAQALVALVVALVVVVVVDGAQLGGDDVWQHGRRRRLVRAVALVLDDDPSGAFDAD